MRLFIAIEFPDHIKAALSESVDALRPALAAGRFSRTENYHLTLVFLGETAEPRLPAVTAAMDACDAPPVPLAIGPLGRFRGRDGDTVWRRIDAPETLWALQRDLTDALRRRGFAPEDRPYAPHLTLARGARLRPGVTLSALSAPLPVLTHTASRMTLMRSDRAQGRLTYTPLHRTPLTL